LIRSTIWLFKFALPCMHKALDWITDHQK
jgi:hypothetical protein